MFEVGFSELLLIMGLALLVLGPEKLPKVVTEIGRWMGRARAMARQFKDQLEMEAAESSRRKTSPTPAASEAPGTADDSHKADGANTNVDSPDVDPPDVDQPADISPSADIDTSSSTGSTSSTDTTPSMSSVNEIAKDDERRSP